MSTISYQPNLSFEYKESKLKKYIIKCLIILIVLACATIPYVNSLISIRRMQMELAELTHIYDKTLEGVDVKPISLESIKNDINIMNDTLQKLETDNYKLDLTIFQVLEQKLPESMWLTEFEFSNDTFYIKGKSPSLINIDILFDELKTKQALQKLQLKTTAIENIYEFEIKNTKIVK